MPHMKVFMTLSEYATLLSEGGDEFFPALITPDGQANPEYDQVKIKLNPIQIEGLVSGSVLQEGGWIGFEGKFDQEEDLVFTIQETWQSLIYR